MRLNESVALMAKKSPVFILIVVCACLINFGSGRAFGQVSAQKTFSTPKAAVDALIAAGASEDVAAVEAILGPNSKDLVDTGDDVADKNAREAFLSAVKEKKAIKNASATKAILSIGNDDWPFPIPIVKRSGRWRFDTAAGRSEILKRRIGTNELAVIQVCRGYVEAQHEYAEQVHDSVLPNQYAQQIISTPGKHDGLYWKEADGSSGGPVGEQVAQAIAKGYSDKTEPYQGYYFKVLKGQGPSAPMGQIDFLVKGAMIGGFALVASPAQYRVTGVETFIVSHDGIVYQKDLGPNTLEIFKNMQLYNPDKTWRVTNDSP